MLWLIGGDETSAPTSLEQSRVDIAAGAQAASAAAVGPPQAAAARGAPPRRPAGFPGARPPPPAPPPFSSGRGQVRCYLQLPSVCVELQDAQNSPVKPLRDTSPGGVGQRLSSYPCERSRPYILDSKYDCRYNGNGMTGGAGGNEQRGAPQARYVQAAARHAA